MDFSRTAYADDTAIGVIGEIINLAIFAQSKNLCGSRLDRRRGQNLGGYGDTQKRAAESHRHRYGRCHENGQGFTTRTLVNVMRFKRLLSGSNIPLPHYTMANLRGDALGGLTTGLVLMPVALGYGVMAGMGPVAGVWGSIAVGLFAAIFGGTRGLISGPNLFTTIAMGVVVTKYTNNLAEAVAVVILAGMSQIAFGLLGLGRYAAYTSPHRNFRVLHRKRHPGHHCSVAALPGNCRRGW